MDSPSYIKVGRVVEPKGLSGQIKAVFFAGEATWLEHTETLRLTLGKNSQDFKILKWNKANKRFVFTLQGINDRDTSESWQGADISIDETLLASEEGESFFLRELLHYKVFDSEKLVGEVTGFDSNGAQDLLIVKTQDSGKEIFIPLIKDFLIRIDENKKIIEMNLPEGLCEI